MRKVNKSDIIASSNRLIDDIKTALDHYSDALKYHDPFKFEGSINKMHTLLLNTIQQLDAINGLIESDLTESLDKFNELDSDTILEKCHEIYKTKHYYGEYHHEPSFVSGFEECYAYINSIVLTNT